jgi:ABC-type multidrug transport system permease subunit
MMPGNLFCLQLIAAFGDRRRIALRIGVSALLAAPFIFVGMPARAQAGGIVMVILFTSYFGAAVGHARLRADQRLARLFLLPTARGVLWLDLVLASMLSRLAPAMVVLAGFVAVNGQGVTPASLITLLGWLCSSLLLLTLLGFGTGRLARNNAEVHLYGALVCTIVAFLSGVTPLPERLMWLTATASFNPIALLLGSLTRLTASPAPVPVAEIGLALVATCIIAVTAALRWISDGTPNAKEFDTPQSVVDNEAPKKV